VGDFFHGDNVVDGRWLAEFEFDGGAAPGGFGEAAPEASADFGSEFGAPLEVGIGDASRSFRGMVQQQDLSMADRVVAGICFWREAPESAGGRTGGREERGVTSCNIRRNPSKEPPVPPEVRGQPDIDPVHA
jgi:hypothetical protein